VRTTIIETSSAADASGLAGIAWGVPTQMVWPDEA